MREGETFTYTRKPFKIGPSSSVVTIPSALGIKPGDTVEITLTLIEKGKNLQGDSKA